MKKKRIKITNNKYISDNDPCFIVAEMSANHAQDLKIAKRIIKEAKKAGADAIKLQTYMPDTMTLDCKNKYFMIKHPKWGGQTLYNLYKKAYTPWKWHKELKKVADDEGLVFFSTPFDSKAVDLLEELNVPLYKIASAELVDLPLIKYVAQTGKPIVMSTGMATLAEINEAVQAARDNGAKDIILLKCVSSYPSAPSDMNLRTIPDLQKRFNVLAGLSDHTLGFTVSIAAVGLGAKLIEKHFTISRRIKNPDSFFSLEPADLKELVEGVRIVEKAVGKVFYGLTEEEKHSRLYRRSIFAVKSIKKGELLSEKNIRIIRPAYGIKPKHYWSVLGRKASKNIQAGTPLTFKEVS